MATFALTDAKIYVGGYDLSGDHNTITCQFSADELDDTAFGDTYRSRIGGLTDVSVNGGGFWDSTPDAELQGNLGSLKAVTLSAEGGDEGEVAFSFRGLTSQYELLGQVGEVTPFAWTATGATQSVRGTILEDGSTTRSTTFDGTGYQIGSVAAGESVYGALHVISAGTTLDVTVESDDNAGFTSPTTRLTFTQATGVGSEWLSAAGAIADDYWRVSVTGASGSWKFVVNVGIR